MINKIKNTITKAKRIHQTVLYYICLVGLGNLTFCRQEFASVFQATRWRPCALPVHAESIQAQRDRFGPEFFPI
jgi:hypothetical protein